MNVIVMKFGGTSVANIKKIQNVAGIVKQNLHKDNKLVVVLSAMAGVTNELQKYLDDINSDNDIENDLVLTSGENVTIGILSAILKQMNINSIPLLGWQIPIITDENHKKAKILNISKKRIYSFLKKYDVIVLAGFQGVNKSGNITSLGRGGSDTTAVAIASAINAKRCDIYTDVEGVYSADPNIVSKAKKIPKLAYEEMLEMSSSGAKVLHTRSVELAMKNNLVLQVISSLTKKEGTFILDEKQLIEKEIVSGVSYSKSDSKITISGIADRPGISASIFGLLAKNNINVDMIVQNISQDGVSANITFTVPNSELKFTKSILEKNQKIINYTAIKTDDKVSKISVIGMGMMSQAGVAQKMFKTLADKKINILAISTSEIKLSVIVDETHILNAVKRLHTVFDLD